MEPRSKQPKTYYLSPSVVTLVRNIAAHSNMDNAGRSYSESEIADLLLLQGATEVMKGEDMDGLHKIIKRINRRRELAR